MCLSPTDLVSAIRRVADYTDNYDADVIDSRIAAVIRRLADELAEIPTTVAPVVQVSGPRVPRIGRDGLPYTPVSVTKRACGCDIESDHPRGACPYDNRPDD